MIQLSSLLWVLLFELERLGAKIINNRLTTVELGATRAEKFGNPVKAADGTGILASYQNFV